MAPSATDSDDQTMEFGILLQSMGDDASAGTITRLATTAEANGFDAVWAGDHVTFPETIPDTYPFSSSGEPPAAFHARQDLFDVFQSLTYVAAKTDDIRIGTNVCLAPLRHPVELTKRALSLEALSEGRFEFGMASGWMANEYEIMDVPYEQRGSRFDEFLDIFTSARSEGVLAYDGDHTSFEATGFHPIPDDARRPPLWIGGKSSAAFRRVAEFADGWSIVRDRPAEVEAGRSRLLNAWEDYGRAGVPGVAVSRPVHVGTDVPFGTDRILVGDSDDVVNDLQAYREAGTTHFVVNFFSMEVDEQVTQIERLGEEVLPELRS